MAEKPRDQRSDLQSPAAPQGSPGYPQNFQPIIFDGFEGLNTKPTRPAIEDQQCFWLDNWMPLGKSNLRTLYDIGAPIFLAPIVATTWNPSDKTNIDLSNVNLTADAVAGIAVPPPAGYTTGAVHFDTSTFLNNAGLVAADSSQFSFSFWFVVSTPVSVAPFILDPSGNGSLELTISSGAQNYIFDAANVDFSRFIQSDALSGTISIDVWHNLLGSCDTNFGAGAKLLKVYLDDIDVTNNILDADPSFSMTFNGVALSINDQVYANQGHMDAADFWIAPGRYLDLTVEANRRKFISATGKPVDLGADGSTPTGTAPAIFLRRAPLAAASTFATNLGTGGNFTITGALTNASTSPSD